MANVYSPTASYTNVTPTLESNIVSALKVPLPRKCFVLSSLIHESITNNSKEIQCYYPLLIENIFAFGSQSNESNWNLKTILRSTDPTTFDAVYTFLNPDGTLFNLIKHLMFDPVFKCHFPISYLPASTKSMIEKGIVPDFYTNRLSFDGSNQIALNALEFYLFHFMYFIRNDDGKGQICLENLGANNPSTLLYVVLLEAYLTYFLPLTQNQNVNNLSTNPFSENQSLWKSLSSTTSNLLHLKSIGQDPQLQLPKSTLLNLKPIINITSNPEFNNVRQFQDKLRVMDSFGSLTWKAETFINIFTEMLLSVIPVNISLKQQNDGILSPMFASNSDQMRCVRIFVKHLHYFANSSSIRSQASFSTFDNTDLDAIKRSIWTSRYNVQKKLYNFLRVCFQHWPLDASFRLPLETWLSYIQPWRYVDINEASRNMNEMEDSQATNLNECPSKWKQFLCDNLLFYTVIFQQVIPRFTRLDLTSSKNSLMLFRLTKVFCQPNLIEALKEVENSLETLSTSYTSIWSPSRGSLLSPSLRNPCSTTNQSLASHPLAIDCEPSDFVYSPLFSADIKIILQNLLREVAKAKEDVSENIKFCIQEQESNIYTGFLSSLKSLFADDFQISEQKRILNEKRKTETHLTSVITKLCQAFDLDEPKLDSSEIRTIDMNERRKFSQSPSERSQRADMILDDYGTLNLTETGRYQVLNRLREPNIRYQGNPDTQPVRSFEVAFLVSFFAFISNFVNERYSNTFIALYNRRDFVGCLIRQLLSPPTTYIRLEKRGVPLPANRIIETLPPRVNLRFLANKKLLLYLIFFLLFFYVLGVGALTLFSFVFFIFLIYITINAICEKMKNE